MNEYMRPMVIISMDEYEKFKRFYAEKEVFNGLWDAIERSNMELYVNDKGQMMIKPRNEKIIDDNQRLAQCVTCKDLNTCNYEDSECEDETKRCKYWKPSITDYLRGEE